MTDTKLAVEELTYTQKCHARYKPTSTQGGKHQRVRAARVKMYNSIEDLFTYVLESLSLFDIFCQRRHLTQVAVYNEFKKLHRTESSFTALQTKVKEYLVQHEN